MTGVPVVMQARVKQQLESVPGQWTLVKVALYFRTISTFQYTSKKRSSYSSMIGRGCVALRRGIAMLILAIKICQTGIEKVEFRIYKSLL